MTRGFLPAIALLAGVCSVSWGQIAGKVLFVGDPPQMPKIVGMQAVAQCAALHKDPVYDDSIVVSDNNEVANVIVFIKPAAGQTLKGPQLEKPVTLDQKGCMYTPHVLALEIGQPLTVVNSDPFLHNVHALSIDNAAFNVAQAVPGPINIKPFTTVETFQVKCDVHPWMKAIVRVFDNPYFAVTDEAGKFSIDTKGLPDGTYTVQAWQEVYHDSAPQQVEVKGGKAAKALEFKYTAKAAKAQGPTLKAVHLASADSASCCPTPAELAKVN